MTTKRILAFFLLFLCLPMVYADADTDEDGIINVQDNCIDVFNPDQRDTNLDGYGNICDPDLDNNGEVTSDDGDTIKALFDSTPESQNWNPDADLNGDNEIEMSDAIIWMDLYGEQPGPSYGFNKDKDGWIDEKDNCPDVYNPDQKDANNNGVGDVCEKQETPAENVTVTTNPIFVPGGTASFTGFPEKVESFVGENITVKGKFESTLNYNLYDVEFSVEAEGLESGWYSVSPEVEFIIEKDEEINITIALNIPEDAEIYTYPLVVKASGGSKIGLQTYSKPFRLLLKEKLGPLTTSSTSTTTTPSEEEPESQLNNLYSLLRNIPVIAPVIIIVIIIFLVFKTARSKGTGKYIYGKGWVKYIKTFKFLSPISLKVLLTKW